MKAFIATFLMIKFWFDEITIILNAKRVFGDFDKPAKFIVI